jgi:hypothetical protein
VGSRAIQRVGVGRHSFRTFSLLTVRRLVIDTTLTHVPLAFCCSLGPRELTFQPIAAPCILLARCTRYERAEVKLRLFELDPTIKALTQPHFSLQSMFILNLDNGTYTNYTTEQGLFDGQSGKQCQLRLPNVLSCLLEDVRQGHGVTSRGC